MIDFSEIGVYNIRKEILFGKGECSMKQIICFHNPEESNGFLSNWYLSEFDIDGKKFSSMEQYMMYKKAELFQDWEAAEKILATDQVGKIKMLGRSVRNYEDTIWNGVRQIVVYEGLLAKFGQNEELRRLLLDTGDAVLAECAVQDCIWGIGFSMKDKRRFVVEEWKGQNLLGYTLMKVRERVG